VSHTQETPVATGHLAPVERPAGADDPVSPHIKHRSLALLAIVGASVMDLLDSTIVNVAGPALSRDIGASSSALQWIVAGYTLAFASVLITGARLGDIVGRRRMFLIGVSGFVLASTLCSLAQNPEMLIATRVLQGGCAALMIPQGLGIIKTMFPPAEMAKAFAVFGPMMGLAATAGPVIGGALVSGDVFGLGWRAIFLLNVPVGILALLGAVKLLPHDNGLGDHGRTPRLDIVGMLMATAAALLLIYPLVQGRESGWPAWTFVMMGASVPMFGIFALHQRARIRASHDPFVVTSIFRKRDFSGGVAFIVLFFGAMTGMFFALTLFLQFGLGYTALHSGLTTIGWSIGTMVSMGVGQGLMPKIGARRMLQIGLVIMTVGVAALAWTINHYGTGVSSWDLEPALLVAGFGMGMVFGPFFGIVLAAVDDREVGSASGVVSAVQQLGSAIGVAGLGTLFFDRITTHGPSGAAVPVLLTSAGVLLASWLVSFLMPKNAREDAIG
jgi:EmrB/QacA subfamily drug resistance transporter